MKLLTLSKFYRKFPDFKGKQRLGRMLFKKQIETEIDLVVKGKYDINYLLPNIKENIGYEIFINGIYEKETVDFICSKLTFGSIYIDIGANIGSIVIPVSKKMGNIHGLCIEASPTVYGYLEKNMLANQIENIKIINIAISDTDNKLVSFYSPSGQFGKGHMSGIIKEESINVETIKLDSLLQNYQIANPDFIKIDIEGFEYFAFKGAQSVLFQEKAPDILFEFEDWAESRAGLKPGSAQSFLLNSGYKLYKLEKNQLSLINSPLEKGSFMIYASKYSQ